MAAKKQSGPSKPRTRRKKQTGPAQKRVKLAVSSVHDIADQAREVGDAVIQAGELIKVGANIADLLADRVDGR
jgi:hypothetical protein